MAARRATKQGPPTWGREKTVVEIRIELDTEASAEGASDRVPDLYPFVLPNLVGSGGFIRQTAASLRDARATGRANSVTS